MTKLIKMSLAAAVAVAGLSSTATAGSLADAVKDTTISGKVEVGYNFQDGYDSVGVLENSNGTALPGGTVADTANEWEYDIDLTLNTKVNDMVTAQVGFQADHDTDVNNESTDTNKGNRITLTKMNFTFKTDMATAIVGKQKQPTPFLDDERGDGVVALVPAGPVTLAAGHFTGMTAPVQEDINALAAIGSFGPVNASLWYLDVAKDIVDGFSVNANGTFGPVTVDATHTALTYDAKGAVGAGVDMDAELTKVTAAMSMDAFSFVVGYGMTNDDKDGRGLGVDLTGDNDAKTNFALNQLNLDALNDAQALLIGASATFGATTVGANYLMVEQDIAGGTDVDATEITLGASYAMSKNFKLSADYSMAEVEAATTVAENDQLELSMKYSF